VTTALAHPNGEHDVRVRCAVGHGTHAYLPRILRQYGVSMRVLPRRPDVERRRTALNGESRTELELNTSVFPPRGGVMFWVRVSERYLD